MTEPRTMNIPEPTPSTSEPSSAGLSSAVMEQLTAMGFSRRHVTVALENNTAQVRGAFLQIGSHLFISPILKIMAT